MMTDDEQTPITLETAPDIVKPAPPAPLVLTDEMKQQLKMLDRPIAIKFLPDGKAIVWRREGKYVVEPMEMSIPAEDFPMSADAHLMMRGIYEMVRQIRELKRIVPLLRGELFGQMPHLLKKSDTEYKTILRELEKKELVTTDSVPIVHKDKKTRQVRSLVLLTPLGRGYIKKYVDPEYTLEGIDYGTIEQSKQPEKSQADVARVESGDSSETPADSPDVQPAVH